MFIAIVVLLGAVPRQRGSWIVDAVQQPSYAAAGAKVACAE
jgi:hypothetical protein